MHYYQFNIADYQSHTRHLTPIEDICYRRMLDWIYLHEKPLPKDPKEIARILILNECLTDVEQVLNEFFTSVEHGWINVRAMSEIELFNEKLEKASKAGKASAEARKSKIKQSVKDSQRTLNERSTDVQPNKKQETRNNNQEPVADVINITENNNKVIELKIAEPPQQPSDVYTNQKFSMFPTWEPSQSFETLAVIAGVRIGKDYPIEEFYEFRSYWVVHPDTQRTQGEWEHAFIKNWKVQKLRNQK